MPWEMAAGQVLDLSAAFCFPVSPEFQILSPSPVSLLKTLKSFSASQPLLLEHWHSFVVEKRFQTSGSLFECPYSPGPWLCHLSQLYCLSVPSNVSKVFVQLYESFLAIGLV